MLHAIGFILLTFIWPILVILSLREMGAPVEVTFRTYVAALVLVMSVKAAKGSR